MSRGKRSKRRMDSRKRSKGMEARERGAEGTGSGEEKQQKEGQ
jgi:hypothetical protein